MNDEVLKRLDILAAKLGVAASYLFQVYINQARVEAITDSIFIVFGLLLCYISYKWWMKFIANEDKEQYIWGSFFVGLAGTIMVLSFISSLPTELFNPDYFAISHIMANIKK